MIIKIQNDALVDAIGTHGHKNSVPTVCLDEGLIFVSQLDACEKYKIDPATMSRACDKPKISVIKGKRFCSLKHFMECVGAIMKHIRDQNEELEILRSKVNAIPDFESELIAKRKRMQEIAMLNARKQEHLKALAEVDRALNLAEKEFVMF